MKHFVLATALVLGAALPAKADVRFLGAFNTLSATNCAFTPAGDNRVSRFRPPSEAGNPASGGLSMVYTGGGYFIQWSAPIVLNTFQNVSSVEAGAFGIDNYNTRVKITVKTPATITNATHFVTLKGVLEKPFGELAPCVITFEASFIRD